MTNSLIKKIATLFLGSAIVGVSAFTTTRVFAQSAFPPFGGEILHVKHCECPIPGFRVTVGPPVGGAFLYYPGTTLFPFYNVFTPGTWVLGLHTGTPIGCGTWEDGWCTDQIPTQGLMYMVGTS